MSEANYYSDDIAIDAVLHSAQCIHKEFMTKMKDLQREAAFIIGHGPDSCYLTTHFEELISEVMCLELNIDARYDEAMNMCNSQSDLNILRDFSKAKQKERMSLLREIMENEIAQIASDDKLAHEMRDFVNYIRSLDCPCCRAENGGDQEMCDIATLDNANILQL